MKSRKTKTKSRSSRRQAPRTYLPPIGKEGRGRPTSVATFKLPKLGIVVVVKRSPRVALAKSRTVALRSPKLRLKLTLRASRSAFGSAA